MRDPLPIGLNEKLEASDAGRCVHCRCWLFYQRVERPKYPQHFFFCASCGWRFAAWELWTPGAAERER